MHCQIRSSVKSNHEPLATVSIGSAFGSTSFRHYARFILPLVALVTLCLSARVQADAQVPFKGTFNPIITATKQIDDTHVLLTFDVQVRATQLGKARGPGSSVLDLNTFKYAGMAIWSGANGDSIFLTFTGQFFLTATFGLLDNVETVEIVGGTGRFEGATGHCVAGGQLDITTLSVPAPAPFTGTISSRDSHRE